MTDYTEAFVGIDTSKLRNAVAIPGKTAWTKTHTRWLSGLKFEHRAHRLVLEESLSAIQDAGQRIGRIEKAIAELAPSWSLASVVEAIQGQVPDVAYGSPRRLCRLAMTMAEVFNRISDCFEASPLTTM